MTKKFYQTDEFKSLNDEWTKKLQDSGFDDVEYDENNLKQWSLSIAAKHKENPVYAQSKEEYYRLAESFLNENTFDSDKEKLIWELHTGGEPYRVIAKHRNIRFAVRKVNIIVNMLQEKMFKLYGIKKN